MDYEFGTAPYAHQRESFLATRDKDAYAILWEQGTGKTKVAIDTACYLYENREIDGLLVVAPNGVQQNWVMREVPTHVPARLNKSLRCHAYSTQASTRTWHKDACERVVRHKGLAVLALSYSSFTTKRGSALASRFLKKRRCMMVVDESHHIKTIGFRCKRTRYVLAAAKLAPYRRIMSGTQADSPFDMYAPMQALYPDFWKERGFASYTAFKTHFGIWETGYNPAAGKEFKMLVSYRNLDQLRDTIMEVSDRVTKDAVLDLPPKVYTYRYVEMAPGQAKLYETLRDEFRVQLDSGVEIEAPLAMVRLLRLQQVLCGYVPTDDDGEPERFMRDEDNPRLRALLDLCEDVSGKVIIWARFRADIDLLVTALGYAGYKVVRYDGSVGEEDRQEAIRHFQSISIEDGGPQFFVGNPEAGGEGITLHAASTVIYYSNSFKLRQRLQSEDRAHRIGQEKHVTYVDLVTQGTVDEHVVDCLRRKFDIASQINGDTLREWLDEV